MYSLYAETGTSWQEGIKFVILHELALAIKASCRPFIIGGDWQLDADIFQSEQEHWLRVIGGVVIQPGSWTCNVGDCYSTIDFFVVHVALQAAGATLLWRRRYPSKRTER